MQHLSFKQTMLKDACGWNFGMIDFEIFANNTSIGFAVTPYVVSEIITKSISHFKHYNPICGGKRT